MSLYYPSRLFFCPRILPSLQCRQPFRPLDVKGVELAVCAQPTEGRLNRFVDEQVAVLDKSFDSPVSKYSKHRTKICGILAFIDLHIMSTLKGIERCRKSQGFTAL